MYGMSTTDPHCRQNKSSMVDPPFCRILREDAGMLPYCSRKGEEKSVIHWGQRKLLMSEIEFLTLCQVEHDTLSVDTTVVYAGAAPGTHMHVLVKLFPRLRFVLVDPAPFTMKPLENVRIVQDLFTDALAAELAGDRKNRGQILFISDIRTADPDIHAPAESDARIKEDMKNQWRWHGLLGSVRSMLKFRLPYDKERSEYLSGDIYLPVWGPQTTTECRLVTCKDEPGKTREYDHEKFESQMFFFNVITRTALYTHDVKAEGMDRCYDCRAEVEILKKYITQASPWGVPDGAALDRDVARMSEWVSRVVSKGRSLADGNLDKTWLMKRIKKRQYDDGVPHYEKRRCVVNPHATGPGTCVEDSRKPF